MVLKFWCFLWMEMGRCGSEIKRGIWLHLVVSLVKFIYLFLYLRHHPFSILGNLRSTHRGRSQLVERQFEQEEVAFKIKRLASVDGRLKLQKK